MDSHSLSVLEYGKILGLLREFAASELGREACIEMTPGCAPEQIQRSLDEVSELKRVLPSVDSFLHQITDPRSLLEKLEVGAILEASQINCILRILEASRLIRKTIEKKDYPVLFQMIGGLAPLPEVERTIRKAVSPDDEILDSASSQLRKVRREIVDCRSSIKGELSRMVMDNKEAIQQEMITVRDGRYVVNVKAARQKSFGGVVHGVSGSGQSVFLEPMGVVKLNNSLIELIEKESQEVNRILGFLSVLLSQHLDDLRWMVSVLKKLDFVHAKAHFSVDYDCVSPELNTEGYLFIREGKHPLLLDCVPLTVELGKGWNTILLSGPNTGGKTVALKTVGLLVLMAQSGMEIPCGEGTVIPAFKQIFADIGDQQSIEDHLSTFSSHMRQIIKVLEESNEETLVLLDELGVGTDPSQGEALGMAVLQELDRRRTRVMATSHYTNLKVWVHSRDRMQNAAMLFDRKNLTPTFQFEMGVPGASYGFEIAERMGMDEQYLNAAEEHIDSESLKTDRLIGELERLQLDAKEKQEALSIREERLSRLVTDYSEKLSGVKKERKLILKEAKEEAARILDETRKLAEKLVKEIREKDKKAIKKVREIIDEQMEKLVDEAKPPPDVKAMDTVYVKSLRSSGTVTEVAGELVRVDVGKFKVTVPVSDLEK